jgi:hypothetical protein
VAADYLGKQPSVKRYDAAFRLLWALLALKKVDPPGLTHGNLQCPHHFISFFASSSEERLQCCFVASSIFGFEVQPAFVPVQKGLEFVNAKICHFLGPRSFASEVGCEQRQNGTGSTIPAAASPQTFKPAPEH